MNILHHNQYRYGIIILCSIAIFACAHAQQKEAAFLDTTYKVLISSAITYDTTMKALADLYDNGYMGEETKQDILNIAASFWSSYHAAVDLLNAYVDVRDMQTKVQLEQSLDDMNSHLTKLEHYLQTVQPQ